MPAKPHPPDLVELTRRAIDVTNRGDFDALVRLYAPDAVLKLREIGTSFEGVAAIRGQFEDWIGSFEEFAVEPEEILDLGKGVMFAVVGESGRPAGSTGRVQERTGWVFVWVDRLIVEGTGSTDVDGGRAAAERLAALRAWAMSENLDLARSIYAAWGLSQVKTSTATEQPAEERG